MIKFKIGDWVKIANIPNTNIYYNKIGCINNIDKDMFYISLTPKVFWNKKGITKEYKPGFIKKRLKKICKFCKSSSCITISQWEI